jgi:hypothetical protein
MHANLLRTNARQGDFYPTPSWATAAILDREPLWGRIWEPACGAGDMARVLSDRYPGSVYASDL